MAKKRLNKKVAIMGSTILVVFLLGVVVIILRFSKDPSKFLSDAQVALAQYDYGGAERNYRQAYGSTRDDDLKIEILFKMARLHLIDDKVHEHEPDWIKALSCWNTVINIDPKNIEAQMAMLKYFYESGDSGNTGAWQMVESTASELAQIIDEKRLDPDPYVLLAKARAKLEIADSGQTSEREKVLVEAMAELEQLKELTPDNIDVYKYLARAEKIKGEIDSSKGILGATQKAADKAEEILKGAVDIAPDNVEAYINLLDMRFGSVREEVGSDWRSNEKVQALEGDFKAMVEQFGSDARAYRALARFYQLDIRDIDKAVEAIEKAVELDRQDISNTMAMAELYYRKGSIYENEDFLTKAIKTVENALNLPGARDVQGPRQFQYRQNKYMLYRLLAGWCIEQAFEAGRAQDEEQKAKWTAKAEQAVHEIEQIIGTGDNVHVVMWRGMLALVKGDKITAIRQMFNAYEQLKAANQRDQMLSYMLARVFEDEPEIGARKEFLESALLKRPSIALRKPGVMLDYAEVLLKLFSPVQAISLVDTYEKVMQPNDRSRRLRVLGYISSGQFDEAEALLNQMDAEAVDTIEMKLSLLTRRIVRIRSARKEQGSGLLDEQQDNTAALYDEVEIETYQNRMKQLREQLVEKEPGRWNVVYALCQDYVANGQVNRAKGLIDEFLAHEARNIRAQIYKRRLYEPDPEAVSKERLNQITEEVVAGIGDEKNGLIKLVQYYRTNDMVEEAMAACKKAHEVEPGDKLITATLFEMALKAEDMALAEQLVQDARSGNIDDCDGNLFMARIEMAKKNYQRAIDRINHCLEIRPTFAYGYLMRCKINGKLQKYDEEIRDAKKAKRFNPMDGAIARQVAAVTYNRNLRLGRAANDEQIKEGEMVLIKAIMLNPNDWELKSVYAEYISKREPEKAIAIRQKLFRQDKSFESCMMLGNMAMRMAKRETDNARRAALWEIAGDAYLNAYQRWPENKDVVKQYVEYLRLTERQDEAKELLAGDDKSLWKFYLRERQYEKARDTLDKLYKKEPKNVDVVKGLVIVASRTEDKELLMRYSKELLALEDTTKNQLMQIQAYLEAGLVNEANLKLESFRERNPDNPKGIMLEAWITMAKGQLKEALKLLNQNLEVNPESAVAWQLRGRVNRLLGNYDQAVEDLQKSKNIDANPRIQMELATAYHRVGRLTAAIGELVDALKNQQAPPRVRTMLEQLYMQAGRTADLEKFYKETLEKYPDSEFWNYRAGQFAMKQERYEEAEQPLLKSWELSQERNGRALDAYLEALWKGAKYKELVKYASNYIDSKFAPIAYAQIAQAKFSLGRKATAMDYYRKAIQKCGTDEKLVMGILENMLEIVGQSDVAKWCNERLKEKPDAMAANLMMFNLKKQGGEYNKALQYIDKFLALVSPESELWIDQMFNKANTLTMAYMKTADKQYLTTAILEFEKILAKQPKNTNVLNNLAYFLADNDEQLDKAVEYARRAHEASPNSSGIMDTYAYALCKTGDYAKAEEVLQMAIQIFERQSMDIPWDVYMHLGMAQEGLGQKAAAAESYRQALEVGGRRIPKSKKEELNKAIERVL